MAKRMEDGEFDMSELEELLKKKKKKTKKKTSSCTHSHTCNTRVPDHTFPFRDQGENCHPKSSNGSSGSFRLKQQSLGNREAVRKYREKKKAQTAYLEDEVKRLRALNHHLLRKLQSQATLEAEVTRLRALLVHLCARIDSELGVLSSHKHRNGAKEGAQVETVDRRANTASSSGGALDWTHSVLGLSRVYGHECWFCVGELRICH